MRLGVIPHVTPELLAGLNDSLAAQDFCLWCNYKLQAGKRFGAILGVLPTDGLDVLLTMNRGLGAISPDGGQGATPEGGRTIVSFYLPPECIEQARQYLEQFPQWLEMQRELPPPGVVVHI